jgi:signal peptidase II
MIDFFKDKKIFLYGLLIATTIVIIDQISKYLVVNIIRAIILKTNGIHTHIRKTFFLNIVLVWNRGISFGMFNNDGFISIILLPFVLLITIYVLYNLWKTKSLLSMIYFSLIIGGAIGNILDRIVYGAVVDFIDFHIKNLHWPAFNVADVSICCGTFLYLVEDLIIRRINNVKV